MNDPQFQAQRTGEIFRNRSEIGNQARARGEIEIAFGAVERRSDSVSGNWRLLFKFEDSEPVEVDYRDYH